MYSGGGGGAELLLMLNKVNFYLNMLASMLSSV